MDGGLDYAHLKRCGDGISLHFLTAVHPRFFHQTSESLPAGEPLISGILPYC